MFKITYQQFPKCFSLKYYFKDVGDRKIALKV